MENIRWSIGFGGWRDRGKMTKNKGRRLEGRRHGARDTKKKNKKNLDENEKESEI